MDAAARLGQASRVHRSVRPLETLLAAEFGDAVYRQDLASIVGARSDAGLAAWIRQLCRDRLGQDMLGARFADKSVGAVFGLALADGSSAVLKLFPPTLDATELAAIERCFNHILSAGYPAPAPRGPMFEQDGLRGAFFELVEGEVLDAHRPEVRRTLAEALAELTRVVASLDPSGLPRGPMRGETLWDTPHRVHLDYARPGGDWIDARAAAARQVVREASLPALAAHTDWSTKNALFRDGELRAVIDWDSLQQASEPEMVGRAAAEFTAQWEFPARATPTCQEATAFVREYERARGRRFDTLELRVINAAADYLIAQVARQELVSTPGEFHQLLCETATVPLIAEYGGSP